jgi:hypothetical protein
MKFHEMINQLEVDGVVPTNSARKLIQDYIDDNFPKIKRLLILLEELEKIYNREPQLLQCGYLVGVQMTLMCIQRYGIPEDFNDCISSRIIDYVE